MKKILKKINSEIEKCIYESRYIFLILIIIILIFELF